MSTCRFRRRPALLAVAATGALLAVPGPAFAGVPAGWSQGTAALTAQGTTTLSAAGAPSAAAAADDPFGPFDTDLRGESYFHAVENGSQAGLPSAAATPITSSAAGFDGLSALDQRLADAGRQSVANAPSPALCVGNGFVLQAVNAAVRVFSQAGTPLTAPAALGQVFHDGPAVVSRNPTVMGVQHGDPRCLFDQATGRFFVTATRYHVNASGAYTGASAIDLAVSRTGDPRGEWDVFTLDTTSDGAHGSDALPACACFGDQPELGADANGIYITSTLFTQSTLALGGERFYAISKRKLVAGDAADAVTLTLPVAAGSGHGFPTHTDPAVAPPGGTENADNGGTEFLTSLCGIEPGTAFLFALTNTSSLDDSAPSLSLSQQMIATEPTTYLGAFEQRDGSRPLASWIQQHTGGGEPPLEYVSGGTPCSQVVYADGRLWTARMTAVKPPNGPVRTGIAWIQIVPTVTDGQVSGQVARQGYLTIDRDSATLGAIAVDRTGHGVVAFDVYGADRYPSAAYAPIDEHGVGSARIVAAGTVPIDNYDGYGYFGASSRAAWFGSYAAAVTAGDGDFWIAQQDSPDIPRTLLASWGTHITEVHR